MWKRIFILSIVCVFVLAAASVAEERIPVKNKMQKRFDRNRDGFIDEREMGPLHEFKGARERIEELCAMAREHEENAKRLLAEAEELEREVNHGFEEMEMAEQREKMHQNRRADGSRREGRARRTSR